MLKWGRIDKYATMNSAAAERGQARRLNSVPAAASGPPAAKKKAPRRRWGGAQSGNETEGEWETAIEKEKGIENGN